MCLALGFADSSAGSQVNGVGGGKFTDYTMVKQMQTKW